ncbi:hypothetical protein TRICHSKD4_3823 [Roseibium sp. TrichSKD4]|uniref:SMI1/KNR4 family protein n=1 Tax=Roseibium sp. TrichSKD4 TaxID=744980 RepID=UPI0001E56D18|nr:SMI1/KNR4 family protein [Roseibium sp. TrichSKD4]EFO30238.1 hypothetical protein TRICHSKD4_3823 [Roseibium sp. TrichSKD4]
MQLIRYGKPRRDDFCEATFQRIGKLVGGTIPDEYVGYLREYGTGRKLQPNTVKSGTVNDLRVEEFLTVSDEDDPESVAGATRTFRANGMISDNILLFAEAYGGHLQYGLILEGPLYGSVVAMDSARLILDGRETEIPNVKGVYHLARSFDEFIDSLYSDPQELEEWEEDYGPLNG